MLIDQEKAVQRSYTSSQKPMIDRFLSDWQEKGKGSAIYPTQKNMANFAFLNAAWSFTIVAPKTAALILSLYMTFS